MSDPYEIEDLWINAFADLGRIKVTTDKQGVCDGGAVCDPDPERLVELLRSDTLMPRSARETLAELLSPVPLLPGRPGGETSSIYNWKLVPERIKRIDPIAKQLDCAAAFEENKSAGMTAEAAAEKAGAKHNVAGRQVFRYRETLQKLGERLRGK
jgi:hypothetical protein